MNIQIAERPRNGGLVKEAVADRKVFTDVFDSSDYRNIFLTGDSALKILKISPDSLAEKPKEYKYIDQGFDDPAIVPWGKWQVVNPKKRAPVITVIFDDFGNPVKVTRYDLKGDIFSEKNFPFYSQRIW